MSDASVRMIDGRAVVQVGGSELLSPIVAQAKGFRDETGALVDQGEAAADLATGKSVEASNYAAAAAALANRFTSYALGNGATAAGQDFTVVDPSGKWINVYRKGTSTGAGDPIIQLPGKAAYEGTGGADLIGTANGRSVGAILANPNRISVKDHGVVGDGVANDTAALQAAINAARTRGNGVTLAFEGLTFLHNDVNLDNLNNVILDGCGATFKPLAQTSGLRGNGGSNVTCRNMRFLHQAGFNYQSPLLLVNCPKSLIELCEFSGCGNGPGIGYSDDAVIRNCRMTQIGIYPRPAPLDPSGNGYGASFNIYGSGARLDHCTRGLLQDNVLVNDEIGGGHQTDQTGGAGAFVLYECTDSIDDNNVAINASGQGHLATGEANGSNVVKAVNEGTFDFGQAGRNIKLIGGYAEGCNQEGYTSFGVSGVQFIGVRGKNNRFATLEAWQCYDVQVSGCVADEAETSLPNQDVDSGAGAIHFVGCHTVQASGLNVVAARANGIRIDGCYSYSINGVTVADYGAADSSNPYSASGIEIGIYPGDDPAIMSDRGAITNVKFARSPIAGGNNAGADIYLTQAGTIVNISGATADGRTVSYLGFVSGVSSPPSFFSDRTGLSLGGNINLPAGRVFSPARTLHVGTSASPILQLIPFVAGQRDAFLVLVDGAMDGDPSNAFADVVVVVNGGSAMKLGGDQVGSASERAYSVSNGYLLLAMSVGAASVCCTVMQTRSGSQFL